MPTVTVAMRPEITANMHVSRAAFVRFPLGNPFGEPHQPAQHDLVFDRLLDVLEHATEPTIVEMPFRWRRWSKWL